MVNINELKACIARAGKTTEETYEAIGLTKRQWYSRLENAKFDTDEMYELCDFLNIENPMPVFFAPKVT